MRRTARRYNVVPALRPGGERHESLREGARIEAGLRRFRGRQLPGFTTTFEDLHGLAQLPAWRCSGSWPRATASAAKGDWKTAALVRAMKVMAAGLEGGTSFMEDCHHLPAGGNGTERKILGSHMLEVCETIASISPRWRFTRCPSAARPTRCAWCSTPVRPAVAASIVDMGNRFRMVVNVVDATPMDQPLPRLPVAGRCGCPSPT